MEQRNGTPNGNRPRQTKSGSGSVNLLSAIILGVSIIIAGAGINSSVKKLTAAVEAQTFSTTLSSPSNITIKNTAPKNYYTEDEAAAYLNMTVEEIRAAITKKEIKEYVKTSAGYSISQDILDDFFEQKAYDTLNNNNSGEN